MILPLEPGFCAEKLPCSRPAYDSGQRLEENVEVKPQRFVPNVEEVVRLLSRQIAIATGGDLPKAGQPWWNAGPDCLELVVEAVDVVVGERPRTDHAHVAAKHVPDLRQLVDRGFAQQRPHPRQ